MNTRQRARCLKLADLLETKMKDNEYDHTHYKAEYLLSKRFTWCAMGFAVEHRHLFKGLKCTMQPQDNACNSSGLQIHSIHRIIDGVFISDMSFVKYFGEDAYEYIFDAFNGIETRHDAIRELRNIAA